MKGGLRKNFIRALQRSLQCSFFRSPAAWKAVRRFCRGSDALFGADIVGDFKDLFTRHLLLAADLVNAAKNQDAEKTAAARKSRYENADGSAGFLAKINPYWEEKRRKAMLYDHLDMTEKEAALRLTGKYAEDIAMFDRIEEETLKMACLRPFAEV